MLTKLNKNEKGFTLIELMIVVAIIGILAAIAIPNFRNYQLKSKTAEAKTNLGAIKTNQKAFLAEYDAYAPCAATNGTPDDVKHAWPSPASGFDTIGFAPSGNVYYSYEVGVNGGTAISNIAGTTLTGQSGAFCASASGDLDKDTVKGEYAYSTAVTGSDAIVTTAQIGGSATVAGQVQDVAAGEF